MFLARKKNDILFWGLAGLILYMPFHFYICELLLPGSSLDNIVRDVVIIALAVLAIFFREKIDWPSSPLSLSVSLAFVLVTGIYAAFVHQLAPILNILRTYTVPMLIFYVAKSVDFSRQRFMLLNRFLTVELAIVGLYGFLQAFILGDDFLIWLGYPTNDGQTLYSTSYYISHFFGYQRSVGTFVSPNICGAIMAVAGCALFFTDDDQKPAWRYVWGAMLIVGMAATFSRSAMLGFGCSVVICWLFRKSWKKLSKKTLRCWLWIAAVAGIFLLVDFLLWDSLFLRMLLSTFFRTFNGEDPSANAHKDHLFKPFFEEGANLLLPYFGLNGPMAEEFLPDPFMVESSFYLMIRELGIPGAVLYFAPVVMMLYKTVKNYKRYPYLVPAAVNVTLLVSYIFLPNVQTFEIPFYGFLFIGLYKNSSVKKLYAREDA
ncbi:MAG: hypothetical protein IKC95_04765 [Oscillospiraceae bacterium]|nr:hypothetical protein [Oscillospiraceae bacterium]